MLDTCRKGHFLHCQGVQCLAIYFHSREILLTDGHLGWNDIFEIHNGPYSHVAPRIPILNSKILLFKVSFTDIERSQKKMFFFLLSAVQF